MGDFMMTRTLFSWNIVAIHCLHGLSYHLMLLPLAPYFELWLGILPHSANIRGTFFHVYSPVIPFRISIYIFKCCKYYRLSNRCCLQHDGIGCTWLDRSWCWLWMAEYGNVNLILSNLPLSVVLFHLLCR